MHSIWHTKILHGVLSGANNPRPKVINLTLKNYFNKMCGWPIYAAVHMVSAPAIMDNLAALFNASLDDAAFPSDWKEAV